MNFFVIGGRKNVLSIVFHPEILFLHAKQSKKVFPGTLRNSSGAWLNLAPKQLFIADGIHIVGIDKAM